MEGLRMYTWSGSQCATHLCSSPGWRTDKKSCSGTRSWMYLPGAEGWSAPDESHRQLHQERADRMCTSCHREGRPDSTHFHPPPPLILRLLYSTLNAVNICWEGEFMSALWACISLWSVGLFQEKKGHLCSVVSLVLYRAEHCLCWTLTTHLCLVKEDWKSVGWKSKNHQIIPVWGLWLVISVRCK